MTLGVWEQLEVLAKFNPEVHAVVLETITDDDGKSGIAENIRASLDTGGEWPVWHITITYRPRLSLVT